MTELTAEQLDAIRARVIQRDETGSLMLGCILIDDDIPALLSHAAALTAKVAQLEGEHRRRRVDEELPEDGEMVVVGYDGCVSAFIVAKWAAGRWSVSGATFPRQDFDWWAPIPKETDHVAHD